VRKAKAASRLPVPPAAMKLQRQQSRALTVIEGGGSEVTQYDPEKGLKAIAVAEAAGKHFARAKDTRQLFEAIAKKITAQADYIVWRDGVVTAGQPKKNSRTGAKILPAADPGHDIAYRWRKAFCTKGAVDPAKIAPKSSTRPSGARKKESCSGRFF
jgi:hypothetical protein